MVYVSMELIINLEKYYELAALINDGYGTEVGKFQQVYKCNPVLSSSLGAGKLFLEFDNEEDAIWFQLKHL